MANIIILTLAVVGVTYGVRQSRIAKLSDGAPVYFALEPNNSYDPLAIAVLNEAGEHLGYVGRNDPQREKIRKALSEGFVVARATVVGGFTKRDGRVASLGLRVQWYGIDPMFNFEGKDEEAEPDFAPLFEGKRRTDRWFLDRQHKADDIRDVVCTKVDTVKDKVYRRQLTKQRRRAFKEGYELKPNRQTWVYNYWLTDGEVTDWFLARHNA